MPAGPPPATHHVVESHVIGIAEAYGTPTALNNKLNSELQRQEIFDVVRANH